MYAGAEETYEGTEGGNSIVRCLLATKGDISQAELSEPTKSVLQKEEALRKQIVDDNPSLAEWKAVGFYETRTADTFLAAAAKFLTREVIVLELKKSYDFNKSYCSEGAITLDSLVEKLKMQVNAETKPLLLERFGAMAKHSPFVYLERPDSAESMLTAIRDSDYGAWYDRSSTYATPAITTLETLNKELATNISLKRGITQGAPLPLGTGYVLVTVRTT